MHSRWCDPAPRSEQARRTTDGVKARCKVLACAASTGRAGIIPSLRVTSPHHARVVASRAGWCCRSQLSESAGPPAAHARAHASSACGGLKPCREAASAISSRGERGTGCVIRSHLCVSGATPSTTAAYSLPALPRAKASHIQEAARRLLATIITPATGVSRRCTR